MWVCYPNWFARNYPNAFTPRFAGDPVIAFGTPKIMRIAFIGQKGIPVSQGGVERHVEELAKNLAARGHRALVYSRSTYKTGSGVLPPEIEVKRLPTLPFKAWDTIIHTFLASVDVLFRKVDVIHYHSLGPAFFCFLPKIFKRRAKIVFTHHTYETFRPQWGILAKFAMICGEFVGMLLADEVIAISPIVAMDLERRFRRRVTTLPNGVSHLTSNGSDFSIALPEKYILAVSRIIRSKGLEHLINAFNLIASDYPDYELVIVGSPTRNDNILSELYRLKGENSKIHFLGSQSSSRLDVIYRKASVFVQASEVEGMPIALLEAASYAIPIIASDISEHRIILRSQGLTFTSGNYFDLASKLRMVLSNPNYYHSISYELSRRVKTEFDWNVLCEKILTIYHHPGKIERGLVNTRLAH